MPTKVFICHHGHHVHHVRHAHHGHHVHHGHNPGGEAGQTDNPAVKPSASGGFTNDPSDLGLEMTDSEDEGGDVDIDSEDNSRLSAGDDSRMSDSMSNTQVRLS